MSDEEPPRLRREQRDWTLLAIEYLTAMRLGEADHRTAVEVLLTRHADAELFDLIIGLNNVVNLVMVPAMEATGLTDLELLQRSAAAVALLGEPD